jgi:hypothetical protein
LRVLAIFWLWQSFAGAFLADDVEDAHPQHEHYHPQREDAIVRNISMCRTFLFSHSKETSRFCWIKHRHRHMGERDHLGGARPGDGSSQAGALSEEGARPLAKCRAVRTLTFAVAFGMRISSMRITRSRRSGRVDICDTCLCFERFIYSKPSGFLSIISQSHCNSKEFRASSTTTIVIHTDSEQ